MNSKLHIWNTKQSLILLTERLTNSDKVYYTRWGDNDILNATGKDAQGRPLSNKKGMGGNQTVHTPELKEDLRKSFSIDHEDYCKAVSGAYQYETYMRDGVFAPFKSKAVLEKYIMAMTKQRSFYNPIMPHYFFCFYPVMLKNFLDEYIRPFPKLFISHLKPEQLHGIIGDVDRYIQTPQKNSYSEVDRIWLEVQQVMDSEKIKVVIPNTGQLSRILAGRMWEADYKCHCIDMGSLFDAMAGEGSRTWVREEGFKAAQKYWL